MIRVGNETYAKENKSYGLTTLLGRHVKIDGPELKFHFKRQERQDVAAQRPPIGASPGSSDPARNCPASTCFSISIMQASARMSPPLTSTAT